MARKKIDHSNTINNSYKQLIIIYSLLVLLISFQLLWKFTWQLNVLALVIGVFALWDKSKDICFGKYSKYFLFGLLVFIFITRIIPYFGNDIPLGYDAGIYKYLFDNGLSASDNWIYSGPTMELGFRILMLPFSFLPTNFQLTYLLGFFSVILGLSIYVVTKKYYGSDKALLALFIFSISTIQLKAFDFMYYKNIIAMSTALFAIAYKDNKKIFIPLMIVTGAVHRPTFFILGLSYAITIIANFFKAKDIKILKNEVITGLIILAGTALFYLGPYWVAITQLIKPVATSVGDSPGTFISFTSYQFSVLPYLPFAITGLILLLKKKDFNMITTWGLVSAIIVIFQFFFFNRFLIHLDIALIIFASVAIKKNYALPILGVAGIILMLTVSTSLQPPINNEELSLIKELQNTPNGSYVMNTDKIYSPWVLAYSNRPTISPGLWDLNQHNQSQWKQFWNGENIKGFMNEYPTPLYIFIGQKQHDNLEENECFQIWKENGKNKIYQYIC